MDCKEAFEAHLATLPLTMQATIRDSMERNESNSWKFWEPAWQTAEVATRERCASLAGGARNLCVTNDEFSNGWASASVQIEQVIRMTPNV